MRIIMICDTKAGGIPTDCVVDDSITTWGQFLDKYPQFKNTKATMGEQWNPNPERWVLNPNDKLPTDDGVMIYLVEDKHKGA